MDPKARSTKVAPAAAAKPAPAAKTAAAARPATETAGPAPASPPHEKVTAEQVYQKIFDALTGKTTFGEILGVTASHAYALAQTGYKLLQEGKLQEAETMFRGLVRLNPKDAYMHLALGSALHRQSRVDEAIEQYSKAIEIDPKLANAFANRGELYITRNEHAKALQDLRKAVELDPNGKDPTTARARAILAMALQIQKTKQAAPPKKG